MSEISQFSGIAFDSMKQIETGRVMADNALRENANEQICFNDDGDSNEIDESDLQYEKHDDRRTSTEHGIKIDSSPEPENAFHPIRCNDDGDSNEIDESDLQQ
jgi:hypothetical protein